MVLTNQVQICSETDSLQQNESFGVATLGRMAQTHVFYLSRYASKNHPPTAAKTTDPWVGGIRASRKVCGFPWILALFDRICDFYLDSLWYGVEFQWVISNVITSDDGSIVSQRSEADWWSAIRCNIYAEGMWERLRRRTKSDLSRLRSIPTLAIRKDKARCRSATTFRSDCCISWFCLSLPLLLLYTMVKS